MSSFLEGLGEMVIGVCGGLVIITIFVFAIFGFDFLTQSPMYLKESKSIPITAKFISKGGCVLLSDKDTIKTDSNLITKICDSEVGDSLAIVYKRIEKK